MKTNPRTLLLNRHEAKKSELDRRWEEAIAPALAGRSTNSPTERFRHNWFHEAFEEVVWVARWGWATLAMTWGLLLFCNRVTAIPSSTVAQETKTARSSAAFAQTLLLRQHFLAAPEGAEWTLPSPPASSAKPPANTPLHRPVHERGSSSSGLLAPAHEPPATLKWVDLRRAPSEPHALDHPGGTGSTPC